MQILMMSHGHPAFSIGGAEVASYNLFQGLNGLPRSAVITLRVSDRRSSRIAERLS